MRVEFLGGGQMGGEKNHGSFLTFNTRFQCFWSLISHNSEVNVRTPGNPHFQLMIYINK